MSFALLAPLGLLALAALALPVLIHLVRRIELRTTEFPALRWIAERTRPRRRIRIERPWLLLIRLALLAAFALLLAKPILDAPVGAGRARVVVASGADLAAARSSVSLIGADWRWLAPDFPPIESAAPSGVVPTASLLRELDATLPRNAALAVVVPAELDGLDGERPRLSRDVEWHVVPGRMPAAPTQTTREAIDIAVRYAPESEPALAYIDAAVAALNARGRERYAIDAKPIDATIDSGAHALIWLGAALSPHAKAWVDAGGTAIVDAPSKDGAPVWADDAGRALARATPSGRGRLVALSGALAPATFPRVLDADFPERLRKLLRGAPRPPTRAAAEALRPALGEAVAPSLAGPNAKPLDAWLALAIAVLFAAERIVATSRQEATA